MEDSFEYLTVPSGKSCRMDSAVTDLPDPDSPTKDKVFPLAISKEILSTALKAESFDSKSITKFLISSILSTFDNLKFKLYRILFCKYKRTIKLWFFKAR